MRNGVYGYMLRNKCIVFLMIFIVGVLFANELYIQYLSYTDSNFYYVSFYSQSGKEQKMLEDIEKTAKENNLKVFYVYETSNSIRNQKFVIYASDEVREYLESEEQIFENKQGSLFSGNVTIKYRPYNEIEAEMLNKKPDGFKLIGKYEDMYEFKVQLIDEYAGGFPHFDGYNSLGDIKGMIYMVWAMLSMIILLVEYYLISIEKKEIYVRFTVGESLLGVLRNCILRDSCLLVGIALIIAVGNALISGGMFEWKTMLLAVGIMIICIAVFYLRLFWYDISEVFSNKVISQETIVANYIVKGIVLILVMCIASVNVIAISQWLDYRKQRQLFKYHKKDYYLSFYHDDNICKDCEFYEECLRNGPQVIDYLVHLNQENKGKASVTQYYTDELDLSKARKDIGLIYISCNAEEYLKEVLPEIREYKENTLYILAPKSAQCTKEEQEELYNQFSDDIGRNKEQYDREFIEYDNVKLTAMGAVAEWGSEIHTNPIIIFETIRNKDIPSLEELRREDFEISGFYDEAFIEITEEEIDSFLKENNVCQGTKYYMDSVWETYRNNLDSLHRFAVISMAIIGMMLSLLVFVNQTLLKMLYNGNGIELAIKKVSGYSIIERFKGIFIGDLTIGVVSMGIVFAVCKTFKLCNPLHTILVGIVCMLINTLCIIYNCRKMDKEKIQKILKGGSL